MQFKRSLAAKLVAAFGVVLLLMFVAVFVSGAGLQLFAETIDTLTQKTAFRSSAARDLHKSYSMLGQHARNAAILSDLKLIDLEVEAYKSERQRFEKTLNAFSDNVAQLGAEPEEIASYEDIVALTKPVLMSLDKAIQLGVAGDSSGAVKTLTVDMRKEEQRLTSLLDRFIALQDALTSTSIARVAHLKTLLYAALSGIVLCAFVVALIAAWRMTRSIVGRINFAAQLAKDIAAGHLRSKAIPSSQDEVGQLLVALDDMRGQLTTLVADIGASADSMDHAAAEVSAGNQDLSHRTEASAVNIEKANAWLAGLLDAVKENSQRSTEAYHLSNAAKDIASEGRESVALVVKRMQDISNHSHEISKITAVIDGIAFQTNILALNAAVEAARAGEHGRGFAVVAGEVRLLAGRAAEAAKQIRRLIETSAASTQEGTGAVNRAGTAMGGVLDSVVRLGMLVQQIQASGLSQTHELAEVALVVSEIEDATQRNAALVEESAAAASALKDQSSQLMMKTQYFVV